MRELRSGVNVLCFDRDLGYTVCIFVKTRNVHLKLEHFISYKLHIKNDKEILNFSL